MRNNKDFTPMLEACIKGYETSSKAAEAKEPRLQIVQALLGGNAEPNKCRQLTGMTPMHWAAYNGDEGVIECLLENDG